MFAVTLEPNVIYLTPKEIASDQRQFLTVSAAAKKSAMRTVTVYRSLNLGEITRYRCGRFVYVCWDQLVHRMDSKHAYWSTIMFGSEDAAKLAQRWRKENGLKPIRPVRFKS